MLFKYRRTKCTITMEELMAYFKELEDGSIQQPYEGTFEEWVEAEMENEELTALEEVSVTRCLDVLYSKQADIRNYIIDEAKEILNDRIDCVFFELQEKYKIKYGDIYPDEAFQLDDLKDKMAEVMAEVVIGQRCGEFAMRMEVM